MRQDTELNDGLNVDYYFVFKNGAAAEFYGYINPQQNSFDSDLIDITKISGGHIYVRKNSICYFEEMV